MGKSQRRKTRAEASAIIAAVTEGKVSGGELVAEIEPLLEEYFIGKPALCGDGLIFRLLNGQSFLITAREISET